MWAGYSVLSRRFGEVPTDAVAGFCLATALSASSATSLSRRPSGRQTTTQWLALLALGLGPVGAAFYVWDIGIKRGDIRFLGVASYATPVLSTLLLVGTRRLRRSPCASSLAPSPAALIVLGALVGDACRSRRRPA